LSEKETEKEKEINGEEKEPEDDLPEMDIGAITGNWGKNISYEGFVDPKTKVGRVKDYFGGPNKAISNKSSFFYEKNALDIFLLAMTVGKNLGLSKPLVKKASNLPKGSLTDKQTWAMIAVALAEEDSDIFTLKDGQKIYQICEEYANGGIDLVIDWDQSGTITNTSKQFLEKFEEFLNEK